MKRFAQSNKWSFVCLFVAIIALIGAMLMQQRAGNTTVETQPVPERVTTALQPDQTVSTSPPTSRETAIATETVADPTPDVAPTTAAPDDEPVVVEASDILHVGVPAVGIDIAVSGETQPRKTERCKGAEECIDPPIFDQAAWYGAVPAVPSTDTVRLFAHTGQSLEGHNSFNNLPAVMAGDEIVVTTETGTFTYRAEDPVLVPYKEVPYSWFIWGDDQVDRVILITCNNQADSATVVEAWLISAEAL